MNDWHDTRCERQDSAPKLPTDRPPTRRETWAHFHSIYFDRKSHKPRSDCSFACLHDPVTEGELERFCKEAWAWWFFDRVVRRGWDKHPDWDGVEGVIEEACATAETFQGADPGKYTATVYALLQTATQMRAA